MSASIEPYARRHLGEVAGLLAESLEHDPIYLDIVPARSGRRRALEHFFWAYLRSIGEDRGVIDLARDGDGALVGVAVWERTGVGEESAFLGQLLRFPLFLRGLGLGGMFPAKRMQESLEAHRPIDPHWYLPCVAVRPANRRAGTGSALLRPRLRQLDEEGMAAYLESGTIDDRRFFETLGFGAGAIVHGMPVSRPVSMFRAPGRRRR